MRTKFFIYASLGLIAASSIATAATFAYAASGQLGLLKANVTIVTRPVELTYNGGYQEVVSENGYHLGELNIGDYVTYEPQINKVFRSGKYKNSIKYKIYNNMGKDVTSDYNIREDFGEIKVKPRKVELTFNDSYGTIESIPDGYSKISQDYVTVSGDGFAENDIPTFYCNKVASGNGTTFKCHITASVFNKYTQTDATADYRFDKDPLFSLDDLNIPDNVKLPEKMPPMSGLDLDNIDIPEGAIQIDPSKYSSITDGPDLDNVKAFAKIKSDTPGAYIFRSHNLGDYDHKGFQPANEYSNSYYSSYNPNEFFTNYLKSTATPRNVEVEYLNNYYSAIDVVPYFADTKTKQQSDVKTTISTPKEGTVRSYKLTSYSYVPQTNLDLISTLRGPSDSSFLYEEQSYRYHAHNTYLSMPSDDYYYKDKILDILRSNGIDPTLSLKNFNDSLTKFFKDNFQYQIKAYEGIEDNVIEFLTTNRSGNCQNFAAAATMIYRARGIPARFTVGFGAYYKPEDVGKKTVITDGIPHAWTEIYVDSYGWIPLDYTPIYSIGNIPDNMFEEKDPIINDPNATTIPGNTSESLNTNAPTREYFADIQVSEPGDYYLRQDSFGDFQYDKFAPANKYSVSTNTNPNSFVANALRQSGARASTVNITYANQDGGTHALVPNYYYDEGKLSRDCDLYFDSYDVNSTYALTSYPLDYMSNKSSFSNLTHSDPIINQEEYNYYYFAKKQYSYVPEDIKSLILSKLNLQNGFIPNDPGLICDIVNEYFKNSQARFNPNMKFDFYYLSTHIKEFITNNGTDCNSKSVSSIANLILRSLKVPTRLVKGYYYFAKDTLPHSIGKYNEYYWNEVYFKGIGWIQIDFLASSGKLDKKYYGEKKRITIKSDSVSVTYDGKYHSASEPYLVGGDATLMEGHYFMVTDDVTFGATDATSLFTPRPGYIITDYETMNELGTDFLDLSYQYCVNEEFGSFEIKKTPITIYLNDIKTVERIECNGFTMSDFNFKISLLYFEVQADGTIVVSTYPYGGNIINVFDKNFADVTKNFDITFKTGSLWK